MPSTTPHGTRIASARLPGTSDGITSPAICVVIDAASRSMFAASVTLKPIQPGVAPVSATPVAMNASMRASIRSAAFSSSRRRSVGASADHAGNARCAASIAASASAAPAAGARDASAPVAD